MFGNIKKNNVRSLDLKTLTDRFYDFMLYKGEAYTSGVSDLCVATSFNANDLKTVSEPWLASHVWGESINSGLKMNNIGFTGLDNGFIVSRKDQMTNNILLNLMTGSTYSIPENDVIMRLHPITGNTMRYQYPIELNEDFVSLKGGFYQGFYKVDGKDYSVLPQYIDSEWNFEFVLRKKNYEVLPNTLNSYYPDNNGMFFYMGTRAENKFAIYYDITEGPDDSEIKFDEYFSEYNPEYDKGTTDSYIARDEELKKDLNIAYNSDCGCQEDVFLDGYFAEERKPDPTNPEECIIDDYFTDDYTGLKVCSTNGFAIDDEYFEADVDFEDIKITTENGYELNKYGYETLSTDNKHMFFNHTNTGYTVNTWDETIDGVDFIGISKENNDNKFVTFNRTETGYTVDIWEKEQEKVEKVYDIFDDIKENAFGLKINDDGSISYRYGVTDCENANHYGIIEEKSKPNIIKEGEWVTINVRASLVNSQNVECDVRIGKRKMRISIYVNGKLVLVSKELPEFRFRGLNDVSDKQEGVPFNISLGGGTQGLIDAIWPDDVMVPDTTFTLMKDFGGTFLGDLKSFKFYDCFRDYTSINNSVFKGI